MLTAEKVLNGITETVSIDNGDEQKLLLFCEAAAQDINSRMKPDANPSDIRLLRVAAAYAYRNFLLVKSTEDENICSFHAADITVSENTKAALDAAKEYLDSAYSAASPLLTDPSFMFGVI